MPRHYWKLGARPKPGTSSHGALMAEDWSVMRVHKGKQNHLFRMPFLCAPHCSPHQLRARILAFRGFRSLVMEDWKPGSNVLRISGVSIARQMPLLNIGFLLAVADAQNRHLGAKMTGSAERARPSITEAGPPESTMALGRPPGRGGYFAGDPTSRRRRGVAG